MAALGQNAPMHQATRYSTLVITLNSKYGEERPSRAHTISRILTNDMKSSQGVESSGSNPSFLRGNSHWWIPYSDTGPYGRGGTCAFCPDTCDNIGLCGEIHNAYDCRYKKLSLP